jgi:hypothetical protein
MRAAFCEESRIKFANATKLNRKSGRSPDCFIHFNAADAFDRGQDLAETTFALYQGTTLVGPN